MEILIGLAILALLFAVVGYDWLGFDAVERPVCISGNPDIHRNGPYGHFLLKSGNCYHYKSINRWHGLALIRSYGYKLEIVRNSQDGTGLAAAVAIGRSLKRRKAEP